MQRMNERPNMQPSDGIREILRSGSGTMLAVSVILCAVLTVMRQSAHTAAGASAPLAWLRSAAMIAAAAGAVCCLASMILPKGWFSPAIGMLFMSGGMLCTAVCTAAELALGYDALWTVQTLLEAAALLAAAAAFFCAGLVGANMRTLSPVPANIACTLCVCSLIMLLMRITVSFSSVFSVGGYSLDFSGADKYIGQIKWIYATAEPAAETAGRVMLCALCERIALALTVLCTSAFFSGYAKKIAVFSRRLSALDDIPVRPVQRVAQTPAKTQPEPERPAFRPRQQTEPEPERPAFRPRQQTEPEPERPAFRPRQRADISVNQPQPVRQQSAPPEPQPAPPEPQPAPPEPQPAPPEPQPAPSAQPAARTAVKVKISRPSPKPAPAQPPVQTTAPPSGGDSIWDRYAD